MLTGSDGQYYFNLIASNGQVILSSMGYSSNAAINQEILAVQAGNYSNICFEKKFSRNGKYYFVLRSADGRIIGTSELYNTEGGRDNGMEAAKNNARDAEVIWAEA
ncbi:MAG: DUF1508 domain-containing protein [Chitinophagaceae bacterium]|nr:MAG: DUF1508 domain-containing protein [Chitinophagaceae bacterium]